MIDRIPSASPPTGSESTRRLLTLIPASSIVISSMIGTGIFTTTGLMVAMGAGGGDILLAWLLGGIVALCGALCYGEIGANLPRSGGEYYYLSREKRLFSSCLGTFRLAPIREAWLTKRYA
jgi:APA family basic amino acid/polyamine antiporter